MPAKLPRKLVESKFRRQIEDRVKGSLLMDSLAQVNDESHFSAISEPDLDYDQVNIPESGAMTYEFDIEVRPEFEMPNWKGLEIERPERDFSDADIDQYLKLLIQENSDLVPVEEAAKLDDEIICNIVATLDGKQVASHDEVSIAVMPEVSFNDGKIVDFDKLVVGKKAGDKFSTSYKVSDHADDAELQGKELNLEFEVLDVKRIEEIGMEALAEVYGLSSEEKLREGIKSSLEQQLSYEQRQQVRNQISSMLTESANWELPPDLLKRQFRRELSRALMELRSSGFSPDEIKARENLLRQDSMARTETLLKEHFILERIAEQEKVEDEPMDYDLEIARIAASSGDSPRRVRSRLEKSGQIDVMRNMIIERKVIELIEKEAKFKATKYDLPAKRTVEAVELAISGRVEADIPEAKYEQQPEAKIPGLDSKGN
ncbi:MAG: trigger factor [Pirellulaceae bacterium]